MQKFNKFKKAQCIIFSLLLILCSVPFSASAASVVDTADYKYTVTENGEAQITGLNSSWVSGELHIPEIIDGYPVTSIKTGAFNSGIYISVAVIPASVTEISPNTFGTQYVSITVDENNPNYASDENGVLFNKEMTVLIEYPSSSTATSYTVPNTVTKIDKLAFQESKNLESVTLPDSITTIEAQAFYKCTKLAEINIPDGIETINKLAFADTAIKSFSLGKNLSLTSNSAYNTTMLEKITVDKDNAYYCSDEYGILYDKAQTEILCFPTCFPYEEYHMPNSVKEYNSTNVNQTLKKLYLSKNYYEASPIFSDFPSLEEIHAHNESQYYSSENGILFNKGKDTLCFVPCSVNIKSYTIPESVTQLTSLCFVLNSTIEEVIIPDSVTNLNSAFNNCKALSKLVIPESVTNLSNQLTACYALREVYLPATLLAIGDVFYYNASGVTDIYFTGTKEEWDVLAADAKIKSTVNIHYNYGAVSGNCGENASWSFDELSGTLTISGSGAVDEMASSEEYGWYSRKDSIACVEIIDGVTNVPAGAFSDCENLREVYLGKNVTAVSVNAFAGCSALSVFTSHADSIEIADSAFDSFNEKLILVCPESNSDMISYANSNSLPCITVAFDEENGVLKFNGELTVYNGPKYTFLSQFLNERKDASYIYFEKIVFDGVEPDIVFSDFENADSSAQNLTLTNLYVNLAVVKGNTQENITFEEMLELLESGEYDAFKYIIDSDNMDGEKTFIQKVEDFFFNIGENALRAISSVINFIARLFRRK